jgi:tetratricopeptide (TPR) repeat protein
VTERILGEEGINRYSKLGQRQETLQLSEKAVEARKRTLDEEHLDTLRSMYNLANRYSEVGRRREALQLRERLVALVSTSPLCLSRWLDTCNHSL